MGISKIWNIFDSLSDDDDDEVLEVDVKEEDSLGEPQKKKVRLWFVN